MIKKAEFTLQAVPPSLNVMLRTHWVKRRKEQEKWDLLVKVEWLNHRKFVFLNPVGILYIITFRDVRTRDLDNYIGGTKYITDALKRTFITQDSAEWLRRISIEFRTGRPQTHIKIAEIKSAGPSHGGWGRGSGEAQFVSDFGLKKRCQGQ